MANVWEVAAAVIVSLGGGGILVFALSTWLGKGVGGADPGE